MDDFKKLTTLQKMLYRELYKKSFYEFTKAFWAEADPQPFVDGKLVQFFCETFQYMCRGWIGYNEIKIDIPKDDANIIDVRQNKRNLCINIPPRHSKSMIFNVLAGVWIWTNTPIKLASVSHTGSLASTMNTKRKMILNSEKFKFFFPEISLETNTKGKLTDNRGGELYSINRDAMTGYGADIICNDDLTNAETARKDKEEMNNVVNYYRNTMPSRINDPTNYVILNIQQRLAPNDVTGTIMNDAVLSNEYAFVVLPAIFEKKTYLVCPISGTVFTFNKGDSLWPERFGDYSSVRAQVGEAVFETQYQQKPIATDRTVIKSEMIEEIDKTTAPDISNADVIYASHDFPVKDKDTSDYLGSVLGYRVGSTLYLIDSLEKRMAFVKSVEYVRQLDNLYPGIIQVIEDKANGSPILQQLQDEVSGMQSFQPGTASKMQRLESASLYMASHNIKFVKTQWDELSQTWTLSPALKNLKERLLAFPFVEHDDICDAFSMLVLFVFMDRRYMVYGRAFTDKSIAQHSDVLEIVKNDYHVVFFNKEGDIWKAIDIAIHYGEFSILYVKKEIKFKAAIEEGLKLLEKFAPEQSVFIDCSATDALQGMFSPTISIERYTVEDFERSVSQLNLAFSKNRILLSNECHLTKADIENFKFSKSKDENVKYATTKDGFCACLRIALHYFGGII